MEGKIELIEQRIIALEASREKTQLEIQQFSLNQNSKSYDNTQIDMLEASISAAQQKIKGENNTHNAAKEEKIDYRDKLQASLEAKKQNMEDDLNNKINQITPLQDDISQIKRKITESKQDLRLIAQQNQIYRFAQKWGEHDDILEVSEKELTQVAGVWFGSIAIVCATIGTILALISYIMHRSHDAVDSITINLDIDNPRLGGHCVA